MRPTKSVDASQNDRSSAPKWEIGNPVQVKIKSPGDKVRWVDGWIQRTAQGGAFVQVVGGTEGYFYNRDIQGAPRQKPKSVPAPGARVPGWKASPLGWKNPPPATATVVEFKGEDLPKPIVEKSKTEPANPMVDWVNNVCPATSTNPRSEEERVTKKPNDLGAILARSQQQTTLVPTETPVSIPRIGLPDLATSPAQPACEPVMPFEDFLECLGELVVIPVDKETRKRWLSLARQLHAML